MTRQTQPMRMLAMEQLPFGQPLPFDLYDGFGILFRKSGQTLRIIDLRRSRRRLKRGLFVPADQAVALDHSPSKEQIARLRSLRPGQALPVDVLDDHGRLIQPAGSMVNDRLMRVLKYRPIRTRHTPGAKVVEPTPQAPNPATPAPALFRPAILPADLLAIPVIRDLEMSAAALVRATPTPQPTRQPETQLPLNRLRQCAAEGADLYSAAIHRHSRIVEEARRGDLPAANACNELAAELLMLIDQDPSLSMLLLDLHSMEGGEYLHHHGANVALVAMRLAKVMGWSMREVHAVGLAALLQDVGMLDVPDELRLAPRTLTGSERGDIDHHPAYTVYRLHRLPSINPLSLLIAFQSHERCDGSGYPCQHRRDAIHPLARIIHAADLFAAVTCPRPHRPGRLPYLGVRTILREAQSGRIDADVARAFLTSFGLFPVGSFVQLSNGNCARVLRGNPRHSDRPIVIPLDHDGAETDEELNLAYPGAPTVVAALDDEEVGAAA